MSHLTSMTKAETYQAFWLWAQYFLFFFKPSDSPGHTHTHSLSLSPFRSHTCTQKTVIHTLTIKKDPNEWKAWPVQLSIPPLLISHKEYLVEIIRIVTQVSRERSLQVSCSISYKFILNSFPMYISLQLMQVLDRISQNVLLATYRFTWTNGSLIRWLWKHLIKGSSLILERHCKAFFLKDIAKPSVFQNAWWVATRGMPCVASFEFL